MTRARWLAWLLAALLPLVPLAGCATRGAEARRAPVVPRAPAAIPERAAAASRGVVLVTGYEPFAGLKTNTSWEVARRLEGQTIAGRRAVAVMLPVVWEAARARLAAAIREHDPEAVISMGVGWSGWIEVETTARNFRGRHEDNDGKLAPAGEVEPGGPALLRTRLPVGRIVARLEGLGLPVRSSDDAGTYLCNEAFYALMRAAGPGVPAGFIHLPRAGPDRAKQPTPGEIEAGPVTVDSLAPGIRAAMEEALGARGGVKEEGEERAPAIPAPRAPAATGP